MSKQFVAFARVSSREEEREGFSLAVQEKALRRYAQEAGGQIVKLFRVAETASKRDKRKTFKELLAYALQHADKLKRPALLEDPPRGPEPGRLCGIRKLESDFNLPFVSVSHN